MTKRLTLSAWNIFKEQYPEDIEKMTIVRIPVNRYNIFLKRRRKKKKTTKTNLERYGKELGSIIDWLDENINEQYYVEFDREEQPSKDRTTVFYFIDEGDAMACKLMFEKY